MPLKGAPSLAWIGMSAVGLLLAWTGGFLLSSGNDRCVDGVELHECSGALASGTWHGAGRASLIVGIVLVTLSLVTAVRARQAAD